MFLCKVGLESPSLVCSFRSPSRVLLADLKAGPRMAVVLDKSVDSCPDIFHGVLVVTDVFLQIFRTCLAIILLENLG